MAIENNWIGTSTVNRPKKVFNKGVLDVFKPSISLLRPEKIGKRSL